MKRLSINEVTEVLLAETKKPAQMLKLDPLFLINLNDTVEFLIQHRHLALEENSETAFEIYDDELKKIQKLRRRLFHLREKKILHLAWMAKEDGRKRVKNLLPGERKLYETLAEVLANWRKTQKERKSFEPMLLWGPFEKEGEADEAYEPGLQEESSWNDESTKSSPEEVSKIPFQPGEAHERAQDDLPEEEEREPADYRASPDAGPEPSWEEGNAPMERDGPIPEETVEPQGEPDEAGDGTAAPGKQSTPTNVSKELPPQKETIQEEAAQKPVPEPVQGEDEPGDRPAEDEQPVPVTPESAMSPGTAKVDEGPLVLVTIISEDIKPFVDDLGRGYYLSKGDMALVPSAEAEFLVRKSLARAIEMKIPANAHFSSALRPTS